MDLADTDPLYEYINLRRQGAVASFRGEIEMDPSYDSSFGNDEAEEQRPLERTSKREAVRHLLKIARNLNGDDDASVVEKLRSNLNTERGREILRETMFLHLAVSNGLLSTEVLNELVAVDPTAVTKQDITGRTPLHLMCLEGYATEGAVRVLVEHDYNVLSVRDGQGQIPLHAALLGFYNGEGTPEDEIEQRVIRYILDKHADSVLCADNDGQTPLHIACKFYGYATEIVCELISCRPEALVMQDNGGNTPFHYLCETGLLTHDLMNMIARYSHDLPLIRNNFGALPLHTAVSGKRNYDCLETLQCLLDQYPDGALVMNYSGMTPLACACQLIWGSRGNEKSFSVIHELVSCRPEALVLQDNQGNTPLHWLCNSGGLDRKLLCFLVGYCRDLPFIRSTNGRTPLHEAIVEASFGEFPWLLPRYIESARLLLEICPACAQIRDNNEMTALELACAKDASLDLIYDFIRVDPVVILDLSFGDDVGERKPHPHQMMPHAKKRRHSEMC